MTARFADVLEISLAMSVVLAVLLALRPLLKKRLRAGAFYWVWLLAALRLCIPFNLSLPQAPVTVEAVPRAVYRVDTVNSNPGNHHYAALTEEEAASEEAAAENRPVDGGSIQDVYTPLFTLEGAVAALWLAGAGAFLAWHLAKYVRFRLRVRRWGAPAEDAALLARFEAAKAELGVKNLALLVCPAVGAPLVTGFVNPALLLPRETVSDGVLQHELIHTRRRDLWYKLLLLLSRSLHWFNPLVHWMAAAASRDLERSCDEAAVAGRDAAFRAVYDSAKVDFDLKEVSFTDAAGVLNQTRYTQPCMVAFAAGLTAVLAQGQIDMRALSIAETKDFGIVRMIVDDVYDTTTVLKDAGFIHSLTPVLGVAIPDEPGGLDQVLRVLAEAQVNVEYMYAFLGGRNADHAYMIFRVADPEKAAAALAARGIHVVDQEEISQL